MTLYVDAPLITAAIVVALVLSVAHLAPRVMGQLLRRTTAFTVGVGTVLAVAWVLWFYRPPVDPWYEIVLLFVAGAVPTLGFRKLAGDPEDDNAQLRRYIDERRKAERESLEQYQQS